MTGQDFDRLLDASGLACPLPVLRARRKLSELTPGQVLKLVATDRAALNDIPAFCRMAGHRLIRADRDDGTYVFHIEKGAAPQGAADGAETAAPETG